jgi:hypothetical protein
MEKGKTIHISINSLVGTLVVLPNENGELPTEKVVKALKDEFEKLKESIKAFDFEID